MLLQKRGYLIVVLGMIKSSIILGEEIKPVTIEMSDFDTLAQDVYSVRTKTCRKKDSETDDHVYLEVWGSRGYEFTELDDPNRDDRERGRTDNYTIYGDIGDIRKIKVELEGNDGWCFDYISIQNGSKSWYFRYGRFLDNNDPKYPYSVVLYPQ